MMAGRAQETFGIIWLRHHNDRGSLCLSACTAVISPNRTIHTKPELARALALLGEHGGPLAELDQETITLLS